MYLNIQGMEALPAHIYFFVDVRRYYFYEGTVNCS